MLDTVGTAVEAPDGPVAVGEFLRFLVGWLAPIAILLYEFVFALRLIHITRSKENKLSARAGLLVGLAVWVFVVYLVPPHAFVAAAPDPIFGVLDGVLALIAFSGGFGLVWLIRLWAQTPGVGVLVLVLTASSWTAAYSYVFVSSLRQTLFVTSLFLLIGAGCHTVVRPKNLGETVDLD